MSLLADSSPPPKTLGKQFSESGGFDFYGFRSNFNHTNLDDFGSFPVNCGFVNLSALDFSATSCGKSPTRTKRSRVDLAEDFREEYGINERTSEWSGNVKKPRCPNGEKCEVVIPAVPLRSIPSTNVKQGAKKSITSNGREADDGKKLSMKSEKLVGHQEESWERDSEKLSAIIAEAREYINLLDWKYSTSKNVAAAEDSLVKSGESIAFYQVPSFESDVFHKCTSSGEPKPQMDMVETQGTKIVDLVGSSSVGSKSYGQIEGVPDCKLNESKCEEEGHGHIFMDLDEFSSEQEESSEKFPVDDDSIVVYSRISTKSAIKCNNEPKYFENHKELINLQIIQHAHPQGCKVMETLKLFEEKFLELLKERKSDLREGKGSKYVHIEAAENVKAMGLCIIAEKPFGHIPGIEIGDEFQFRAELVVVGLHRQLVSGIDYVLLDGKKYATSVVNSGRYENKAKTPDILIYSGQGGNPKMAENAVDQKLERGNLALMNSMEMGYPVRVTYKRTNLIASKTLGMSSERNYVYVYDGLYTVNNYWQEREELSGKLVFKFEMHRLSGQPRTHRINFKSRKSIKCTEVCVLDDVSKGKEKFSVRALNGVDNDLPPPFSYITNIVYPYWYQLVEPIGCNCINGCSDSHQCPCVVKNGGEIPFNENGAIIRVKPMVHECGLLCKCPPSCMNRVSQHGPRYQLEIFKTKSRGWGVRSRQYISSGIFICEYVGELLRDKEAEQRIGNDEYLFDICDSHDEGGQGRFEGFPDCKFKEDGFTLDAGMCGNIGRFINHSCSPNLYAQEVLYDHDDKRVPHIMFFATKNIPPLQELTYDYNYRLDRVRDASGNIKTKDCYCGSRACKGRMY